MSPSAAMGLIASAFAFFILELGLIAGIIALSRRTDRLIVAPGLDLVMSVLTWIPWVLALAGDGLLGLIGCIVGQIGAMEAFCFWHEKQYEKLHGPRDASILKTLNGLTSPAANYIALLATLPALPAFLLIRFSELTTYPILVKLVRLPPYDNSEWVSVSRQKFDGLVGHDLVWCLYCDWMTGIYALGGEMLRNLESFWCPIRFYPGKKCENCKLDFPDIPNWVRPDGSVAEVEAKLKEKYEGRKWNSWWQHPERKTESCSSCEPPMPPPAAPQ